MDTHADKTAPGWKRFLDRIRKLWETPPPPQVAPKRQEEHLVTRNDDLPATSGVSSR